MGEVGRLTFIRRVGIPKRSEISQFRFQELICDDLATLCKNMMNVGPVTPEFNRAKDVHPSSISSLASGVTASTARPCGDHYWVLWGDHYSVLFKLFAGERHCYAARATR